MKKIAIILIMIIAFAPILFAQWELRDTIEFQERQGLPNFFSKIDTNDSVKVGFLGGSITAAEGWRSKIVSLLKDYYEIDSLVDFSAAIGGTNSKYGAFRIDRHLLSANYYDLIFVEFAVNDHKGISSEVEKSIEGIISKIWNKNPFTDICFVYTVSRQL